MRILFLLFLLLPLLSCSKHGNSIRLMGQTMGTSWHITLSNIEENSQADAKTKLNVLINTELTTINQQFSTYIANSEISLFNVQQTTQPFQVTQPMLDVVKAAQRLSEKTQGAFDITIAPLIQLWGFGTDISLEKPDDQVISKALEKTGYQLLQTIDHPPQLVKKNPSLTINLSAIAKGYGVDRLASLLDNQGIEDYLVEIGGELRVKGLNPKGDKWQIAIEKPVSYKRAVQEIVSLDTISVATSGDYHNYFEENGIRYSHTIDPKTGKPINHKLASVTVLHSSTMMADALATAIMVLGEEKGLEFVKRENLQVYMIIRSETGFHTVSTLRLKSEE